MTLKNVDEGFSFEWLDVQLGAWLSLPGGSYNMLRARILGIPTHCFHRLRWGKPIGSVYRYRWNQWGLAPSERYNLVICLQMLGHSLIRLLPPRLTTHGTELCLDQG